MSTPAYPGPEAPSRDSASRRRARAVGVVAIGLGAVPALCVAAYGAGAMCGLFQRGRSLTKGARRW